jgi:hypothetical protein
MDRIYLILLSMRMVLKQFASVVAGFSDVTHRTLFPSVFKSLMPTVISQICRFVMVVCYYNCHDSG